MVKCNKKIRCAVVDRGVVIRLIDINTIRYEEFSHFDNHLFLDLAHSRIRVFIPSLFVCLTSVPEVISS